MRRILSSWNQQRSRSRVRGGCCKRAVGVGNNLPEWGGFEVGVAWIAPMASAGAYWKLARRATPNTITTTLSDKPAL
jgi:hypothetical protein